MELEGYWKGGLYVTSDSMLKECENCGINDERIEPFGTGRVLESVPHGSDVISGNDQMGVIYRTSRSPIGGTRMLTDVCMSESAGLDIKGGDGVTIVS